jgi:predicted translin family RNA/ssDNA-binding protein
MDLKIGDIPNAIEAFYKHNARSNQRKAQEQVKKIRNSYTEFCKDYKAKTPMTAYQMRICNDYNN